MRTRAIIKLFFGDFVKKFKNPKEKLTEEKTSKLQSELRYIQILLTPFVVL